MARARNIKPGFFKNEDLAECSPWARLCFAGLWTLADREGRLEDRPKRIKGELFAFDSIEVEPLLQELAKRDFILRYKAQDGRPLMQVAAFSKHQNPHHREPPSYLPPFESPGLGGDESAPTPGATLPSDDPEASGKPEASPGLGGDESAKHGGQAGLIPDSGFRNTDTGRKTSSSAGADRTPTVPCPYREIVAAYHDALPSLPKVRFFDGKGWEARCKAMRELWGWVLSSRRDDETRRAENAEEALAWVRDFFARAAENDFLMGRTHRSAEHRNWCCDLDYLLTERGKLQVIEKTRDAA